jgi:hypothetical protein
LSVEELGISCADPKWGWLQLICCRYRSDIFYFCTYRNEFLTLQNKKIVFTVLDNSLISEELGISCADPKWGWLQPICCRSGIFYFYAYRNEFLSLQNKKIVFTVLDNSLISEELGISCADPVWG